MEEQLSSSKETSNILSILLAVIVTSFIVGAGIFYWQNQSLKKLKEEIGQERAKSEAPTSTPTSSLTPELTPGLTVTLVPADEDESWLTYINDIYNYQFKYPSGSSIEEALKKAFSLSPDEVSAGITFQEKYDKYTGKICVSLNYKLGYVQISAAVNSGFAHVVCGRTGRAYEGPDKSEVLTIGGKSYTAKGFEEKGPGETLDFHNETLVVTLDDGTRIEYGSRPDASATYADYLSLRSDILKIVESFKKI